jgi:hypothetical protein
LAVLSPSWLGFGPFHHAVSDVVLPFPCVCGMLASGLKSLLPSLALMATFAAVWWADQQSVQLLAYALDEFPLIGIAPAALTLLPLLLSV